MEQKNLIPTLCHLCGLQENRTIREFNYIRVMQKLYSLAENFEKRIGSGFSPIHFAAKQAKIIPGHLETIDQRIILCDGMYINVNFVYDNLNVIVLPRTSDAANVGKLWAVIVRKAMQKIGLKNADLPFVLVLVNPRHFDEKHTLAVAEPGRDYDDESAESLYKAFVTAAVTDDETDFDIEIEMHGIRLKASAARQRIKKRMKALGVKSLRGTKATVYLRSRGRKVRVDLKRLEMQYPAVYKDVVSVGDAREYITFKLNNDNGQ